MIGVFVLVACACAVGADEVLSALPPGSRNVCPKIRCPNDRKIRNPDCRRAKYKIGRDGQTKCRMCDINLCGPRRKVCPHPRCPGQSAIPRSCRIKQFVIGTDLITKCRVCDKDGCLAFGAAFKGDV